MRATLCWYCEKPGTGRCSWDESLTPVQGWTAEPSNVDGFDTHRVIKCPLFRMDRRSMGPLIAFISRGAET